MNKKTFFIFAGVNGAGKSSLYNLTSSIYNGADFGKRINTDEIVREIGDWRNAKDQIKAGKIAINKRKEYIEKGITFNQETTLTGNSILKAIENAKKNGYKIYLSYVGVNNPEIAKKRVEIRVKKGGHDIPNDIIEKRYYESLSNLKKIAHLCDSLVIYDNSIDNEKHRRCFIKDNNSITLLRKDLPNWVTDLKNTLEQNLEKKIEKSMLIYNPLTGNELKVKPGYDIPNYSSNQWISKEDVKNHDLTIKKGNPTSIPLIIEKDGKPIIKEIEFYNATQLEITQEFKKNHFLEKNIVPQIEKKEQNKSKEKSIEIEV